MNGVGHHGGGGGGSPGPISGLRGSPNANNNHNLVLVSRQVREERQERVVTRTQQVTSNSRKEGLVGLLVDPLITANGGPCSSGDNNTLTRKSTTTTSTTERKTSSTNLVRSVELMGPDGIGMEYSNHNHAQFPGRPHFPPPPPDPTPYNDPSLTPGGADPYGYTSNRGGGHAPPPIPPPDPNGRYVVGYNVEEYEEFVGEGGFYANALPPNHSHAHSHHRPSTPSEASDDPSLQHNNNGRNNNALLHHHHHSFLHQEYLRGPYPPGMVSGGYVGEELLGIVDPSTGLPRPEYSLSPSANPNQPHPQNYEGGGESLPLPPPHPHGPHSLTPQGNGNGNGNDNGNGGSGPYWTMNNSNTSHYGNLPVRPYLLQGGGEMGGVASSTASASPRGHVIGHDLGLGGHTQLEERMEISHSHISHTHNNPPSTSTDNNSSHNNSPGVRWRDPDLHEVIQFLGAGNPVVKANAAAYLQHLSYMDDPVKAKTRALGGIPPLVALLAHEQPEVHRNACGALRNLSYGRQNDENKKAIKSAGGIPSLVRLLKRTPDPEVRELVTGVLWNLSSCEELKRGILDDGIPALVHSIIIPCSGWEGRDRPSPTNPDPTHTTVFKNSSGVIRNVSSAGEYARKRLRECEGLVEALLHVLRSALSRADIDDKAVENCVCILRNLSYRCQEVEDPNYDKHPPPYSGGVGAGSGGGARSAATPPSGKSENLGCFGANKKKKEMAAGEHGNSNSGGTNTNGGSGGGGNTNRGQNSTSNNSSNRTGENVRGMELLWQPEVVQSYLALLSNCSNPETLEAAAGAIQNLAACYWQPSIEIRAAVRKEKGLPVLVELLRMEVDRVVCAVATALRNLALDQRNKELIGKYAMRDLVQKLPSGRPQEAPTSEDTIAAVLATLNEVIKKNPEFARSLMEAEGLERLVLLTQEKRRFSHRVLKFASQVLYSAWAHPELREAYRKAGWTEADFLPKGLNNNRGSSPGPSPNQPNAGGSPVNANSTLNRPMASQGGTRYEDKTISRNNIPKSPPPNYQQGVDEVPLADMPYPDGASHHPAHAQPPPGAYRIFPPQPVKPGEPLYAQVNREQKKGRRGYWPEDHDHAHPHSHAHAHSHSHPPPPQGGDSWV